jgi:hypothetical protein
MDDQELRVLRPGREKSQPAASGDVAEPVAAKSRAPNRK